MFRRDELRGYRCAGQLLAWLMCQDGCFNTQWQQAGQVAAFRLADFVILVAIESWLAPTMDLQDTATNL